MLTLILISLHIHSFSPLTFAVIGGDLRAEEADIRLQAVLLMAIDRRFGNPKVISNRSLMLSDQLSLSPASASSLNGALHDGFGEGGMPHDMAKPRQLPLPDGCQERFLGTHEALDQAPHNDLVFSVRDVENFLQALRLECLDSSLVICQQSPCLTSVEQDGDNQQPEELEFGLEADVAFPHPVQPGHHCYGCGDPPGGRLQLNTRTLHIWFCMK